MTKSELQQELKEKVKEGVKPSDIKRLKRSKSLGDIPSPLNDLVKDLNHSLSVLKPANSETAQLITYTLLAVAVVGIGVYHYLREQENT